MGCFSTVTEKKRQTNTVGGDFLPSAVVMCAHVGHVHQLNSELWWITAALLPDNKKELQWNILSCQESTCEDIYTSLGTIREKKRF